MLLFYRKKENLRQVNSTRKGFSLVEILVAIAIFTLVASSVAFFAIDVFQANANARSRIIASQKIQEITNALVLNKLETWVSILNNATSTPKHLEFVNNHYQIADGPATDGGVTLSFTIDPVHRDINGNIVLSGGTLDSHSKKISIIASWVDSLDNPKSLTSEMYVNDWYLMKWSQTTEADFNAGTLNFTNVTNVSGGEVQLSALQAGSWLTPSYLGSVDYPGNFSGGRSTAHGNYVYSFETIASSNTSYVHIVDVSNKSVPVLKAELNFGSNQYNFFAMQVVGNYMFLLAENPNQAYKEAIIVLDISNPVSPTTVNTYLTNSWTLPTDMIVQNGYCYVLSKGDATLSDFFILNCQDVNNISIRTMLQIPSADLSMQRMSLNGNYLFIASTANSNELIVMNVADVNNPAIVKTYNLPGNADALAVQSLGNYTYVTRENSNEFELEILNTTDINNISHVGGYDTGNKTYDLSLDLPDNFVFLANSNPQEQFVIVDITNLAAPVRYAGISLTGAATGVTVDGFYAYVCSNSNSKELQIIFGGRGGRGSGQGLGNYEIAGDYLTQILDTASSAPYYVFFNWTQSLAANTTLKIQARSGADPAQLQAAQFVGPDGSSATYFTSNVESVLPNSLQNKRYLQFKIFYTSDGLNTSVLQDITIYYQ